MGGPLVVQADQRERTFADIAQKHGFGPADEQATRNAIHGRPIKTENTEIKQKGGLVLRIVRRIYDHAG